MTVEETDMNIQRPVTALSLRLPTTAGALEAFHLSAPRDFPSASRAR
jgi:hypothetical protein